MRQQQRRNSRTIAPSTATTPGPKRITARPTPVGCEQLPVTDGSSAPKEQNKRPAEGQQHLLIALFLNDTPQAHRAVPQAG